MEADAGFGFGVEGGVDVWEWRGGGKVRALECVWNGMVMDEQFVARLLGLRWTIGFEVVDFVCSLCCCDRQYRFCLSLMGRGRNEVLPNQ